MPTDYLLNDDLDLKIEDGDFVKGESTLQHQKILLLLEKGHLRRSPQVGVRLFTYINDDNLEDLPDIVQKEFELDGMTVKKLQVFEDGKVNISASYD